MADTFPHSHQRPHSMLHTHLMKETDENGKGETGSARTHIPAAELFHSRGEASVPELLTRRSSVSHPKFDVEGICWQNPTKRLCLSPKKTVLLQLLDQ